MINSPPQQCQYQNAFFCGIVQIFDINIIFNEIGVSSEQESPKIGAAGLVAGHPSLICGELHHPSGLQGQRFVRFRIGLTARLVLRTTWRNYRKQGFSTCKHREARASRQERFSIRMRHSLWVSRCTPGLLLQARVIGAEESWVGIQGQVGSGSGSGRG